LYRRFRIGDLADLVMLDTRSTRDAQVTAGTMGRLMDPSRTMLGAAQEQWLFDRLRASQADGLPWRLLGQQVLFSPVTPAGPPMSADMWDGYPAARARVIDFLEAERISDVAILTGDLHSAWALDVPRNPWASPGSPEARSMAVEVVTPAITSAPLFTNAEIRARAPLLRAFAPHLRYLEGDSNGYILLDVTRERLQADIYFVAPVQERSDRERLGASFVCERGAHRLAPA
jgi:alkaline phosphatase D